MQFWLKCVNLRNITNRIFYEESFSMCTYCLCLNTITKNIRTYHVYSVHHIWLLSSSNLGKFILALNKLPNFFRNCWYYLLDSYWFIFLCIIQKTTKMKTASLLAIIGSTILLIFGLIDCIYLYHFGTSSLIDVLEPIVFLIFSVTFYKRLKKWVR